ncbi:MAG TPA: CrcB family protein [Marmoricola sp.]|jgi:CrcB protein|nr:CrcB family protein [Nocardioidaceae bacterium]HMY09023.1 CrcB family protein [Marmoricola sp.]HRV69210.1 CrcB family protein [Marmoricola sp.]
MTPLLVMLGAAIGSGVRYLAGHLLDRAEMHWGTLLVNVIGSFILGAIAFNLEPSMLALIGVGFCGGLTTYSAFAVQAAGHDHPVNWPYIALTLGLCLPASLFGVWLG